MQVAIGSSRNRDRRPSKWRPLVLFWLVQSAVVCALPVLLMVEDWSDVRRLPDTLLDAEWFWIGGPWAVLLAIGQAAMVLPVSGPRPLGAASRLGRWARHAAAGTAIGSIAAVTSLFVALMLGLLVPPLQGGPEVDPYVLFWGVQVGAGVIATVVLRLRWRDRTPIGVTAALAVACGAALLIGLAAAVLEMIELARGEENGDAVWGAVLLAPLVVSWAVGTPLVLAFVRRGPADERVRKLASRLFLGTVVEVVAVIPMDVMVRRKTSCYCGEGTFWALVVCGSVGFLTLGPGVWFLLGRRRRRWLAGRCEVCGYDMSGCLEAERCPECGAGWRATGVAAGAINR